MREYIQNLTNDLITKNRYDELDLKLRGGKNLSNISFVDYVKLDLYSDDVQEMNPETLGKIMAEFDIGDVMAGQKELVDGLHFAGDCEDLLRELVDLCLAYVIRDRLDCSPENERLIPVYRRH